MKIKINKSPYTNKELKKLFQLAAKNLRGVTSAKLYEVKFYDYTPSWVKETLAAGRQVDDYWLKRCRGAFYDLGYYYQITIRSARDTAEKDIIKTILHELGHLQQRLLGHLDRKMNTKKNREWYASRAEGWTEKVLQEFKAWREQEDVKPLPEPKPKPDLQLKRYTNVLEHIKDKERKIKRLQTQLKKWRSKRAYYQKALVVSGKISKKELES